MKRLIAAIALCFACSGPARNATLEIDCDCVQLDGGITVWTTYPPGAGTLCITHDEAEQRCPAILSKVAQDAGFDAALGCAPSLSTYRCNAGIAQSVDCVDETEGSKLTRAPEGALVCYPAVLPAGPPA